MKNSRNSRQRRQAFRLPKWTDRIKDQNKSKLPTLRELKIFTLTSSDNNNNSSVTTTHTLAWVTETEMDQSSKSMSKRLNNTNRFRGTYNTNHKQVICTKFRNHQCWKRKDWIHFHSNDYNKFPN